MSAPKKSKPITYDSACNAYREGAAPPDLQTVPLEVLLAPHWKDLFSESAEDRRLGSEALIKYRAMLEGGKLGRSKEPQEPLTASEAAHMKKVEEDLERQRT